MSDSPPRALVVDDEFIARHVVVTALTAEGFTCDQSVDGADALLRMEDTCYDLVVTDLRMPNKHGHALTVELLSREHVPTPVLVVHTSVKEPRLAKDLLVRGVDEVLHKPTNYQAFAAKMNVLVRRRKLQDAAAESAKRTSHHSPGAEHADEESFPDKAH